MRRVVKPGGRFIFIEHRRAPDARVRVWQDRLTPLWARRISAGCHLNRPIDQHIEREGGDPSWSESPSARRVTTARKSPEVVLEGDTIRIGEDDNVVVLQKAEWNILVEAITSGRLGRI